jgi:membrane-bound lytic murein transglycosylase C
MPSLAAWGVRSSGNLAIIRAITGGPGKGWRGSTMWMERLTRCLVVLLVADLAASCATTKSIGQNVERVANGQPIDRTGLNQAMHSDTRTIEANLVELRRKFAEAVAQLRANVQKRWGERDTRVASRTVYVKYTQGYKSRVITDFDHGFITIETLDRSDPSASLKTAVVAALLTSNDPASVDLFSDKDVVLEPARQPYLYGLVHDNHGHSVRTRAQAEQFASFLIAHRVQVRHIEADQSTQTAHFVKLYMVRNFETKNAERYRASVEKYAAEYEVSPSLVLAIMRTESNFNPFAVSGAPAYGLMQLVPTSGGREAFKRAEGIDQAPSPEYLFDPEHNIELGTAYLSVLSNDEFHAIENPSSRDYCVIAAYNTGAHNVTRTFAPQKSAAFADINGLAPSDVYDRLRSGLPFEETRLYVVKVTGYRRQFVGPVASHVPAMLAEPAGAGAAEGAAAAPQ